MTGAMITTAEEAYQAMLRHHEILNREVANRATSVQLTLETTGSLQSAIAGLTAYMTDEVLPHALAEERTVYAAADGLGLADTVNDMIAEHRKLTGLVDDLTALERASSAAMQAVQQAVQIATQLVDLFTAHVRKENELLLPRLMSEEGLDMVELLAEMHHALELARADGASSVNDAELDVRVLAPAQRHEKIFATYRMLSPGAGFVLINDHDPKPLYYQFQAEYPGEFTWEYLEAGPEVWRIRIRHLAS